MFDNMTPERRQMIAAALMGFASTANPNVRGGLARGFMGAADAAGRMSSGQAALKDKEEAKARQAKLDEQNQAFRQWQMDRDTRSDSREIFKMRNELSTKAAEWEAANAGIPAELRGENPYAPMLMNFDRQYDSSSAPAITSTPTSPNRAGGAPARATGTAPSGTGGRDLSPNARAAYEQFVGMGYSPQQASALVGNMMQESGWDINTSAVGDNGNSFGSVQWNGPRRRAFMKFAEDNGLDPNALDTQTKYLNWEMNNTETRARDAFLAAGSLNDATTTASNRFWRPGDPRNENRVNYANAVYSAMNPSGGQDPGVEVAQASPGTMNDASPEVPQESNGRFGIPDSRLVDLAQGNAQPESREDLIAMARLAEQQGNSGLAKDYFDRADEMDDIKTPVYVYDGTTRQTTRFNPRDETGIDAALQAGGKIVGENYTDPVRANRSAVLGKDWEAAYATSVENKGVAESQLEVLGTLATIDAAGADGGPVVSDPIVNKVRGFMLNQGWMSEEQAELMTGQQLIDFYGGKMTMNALKDFKGAISDGEREFAATKLAITAGDPPHVRRAKIAMLQRMYTRTRDFNQQAYRWLRKEENYGKNLEDFRDEVWMVDGGSGATPAITPEEIQMFTTMAESAAPPVDPVSGQATNNMYDLTGIDEVEQTRQIDSMPPGSTFKDGNETFEIQQDGSIKRVR